ncbi:MAG TPA: glycoside hydrolase family 3 C-terminal domain-containing protein [Solirubrobacteraceae bacterium]|nr:glycoside hydrolase family 3 C-terminal domain-containing protein [Solirubrobacteraceae bacterium]
MDTGNLTGRASTPRTRRARRLILASAAALGLWGPAGAVAGLASSPGIAAAATPHPAGTAHATDPVAPGAPNPCPSQSAHPWCDRSLSPDQRAILFQRAMTLQQEIQFVGGDQSTGGHTGATYPLANLGLRQIYFTDGPVGPRQGPATAMPIPMALAATWSPALAWAYGNEVGTEARDKGNDFVFGPTVNLMRTPQGGRTYEAYGEDTFLAAHTTVGWVDGAQAAGVLAVTKHFVANDQEGQAGVPPVSAVNGGRMLVNVNVDQRTLHEVYFPQFEAAVKQAHTGAIMCSYNRVNGEYSCENGADNLGVLRGQWGFRGIILSDYGASNGDLQNPGLSATVGDLNNGLDFVPNQGSADQAYSPTLIQAALASGQVSRQTLDAHVRTMLATFFAAGMFDRPGYANNDAQIPVVKDQATAETVEQRAIVLLKNDGILPLKPSVHSIAVIGPYANLFVTGGGSGQVTPRAVVTALAGITARAGRHVRITYANGYDIPQAAAVAKAADVAVVVVGDVDSEGLDRSCIDLNCSPSDLQDDLGMAATGGSPCAAAGMCPANGTNEDGLVSAVAAAQRRTVVVLETAGPVLTPWRDQVPAILEAWYPGQEGGIALAHVLFGDSDPAGRLPVTFPQSPSQLPTAGSPLQYPGVGEQEDYSEGIFVGYKFYDAHHETPAFPFGAGLSYTRFRFSKLRLVRVRHGINEVALARVTVTDTGRRAGYAVPELYMAKPASAALAQVPRQLAGYDSVFIRPHHSVTVTFPLNDRSFASWATSGWQIVPGCYRLSVGTSSASLLASGTIARGPGCPRAAVRLGLGGSFTLPLPPVAHARSVRAPVRR